MANTVDHLIRQITGTHAAADAKIALLQADPQGKVDCKPGCDHCCHRIVVAGVSELIQIATHVENSFTPEDRDRLTEACDRYASDSLPFKDGRQMQARPTCPLLVDHKCSAYEVRPMSCRGWNSYSAPACAARLKDPSLGVPEGDSRQVSEAQAAMKVHNQFLAESCLSHVMLDLGTALPELLANPGLAHQYLAGEPILLEHALIQPGPDPIFEEGKRGRAEPSGFVSGLYTPVHPVYEFLRLTLPTSFSSDDHIESSLRRYRRMIEDFSETPMDPSQAFDGLSQFQAFGVPYTGIDATDLMKLIGEKIVNPVVAKALPDLVQPLEPRKPEGRLRVGYLSRNITHHHATSNVLGWVDNHAQDIESFVFHIGPTQDGVTLKFRKAADHFYHVPGDVPSTARFIKSLRLDALVFPDLGNFGENYQYAGMRLAPVQCTSWGQPVTSGLSTIDYFLSSEMMEPANGDDHYCERLIRFPGSGAYFHALPPASQKSRQQLGLPEGPFHLVCQNIRKVIPRWDFLLAEIQARSGLPMVFIDYGVEVSTDLTRDRLAKAGVNVTWLPRQSNPDFIRIQQLCSASLDPPAWNGGYTTMFGLGAGGPLVTMPGEFLRGRHSLAYMAQANVQDLIASTPEQYIEFATDFDRIQEVMKGLNPEGMLRDKAVPLAVDNFFRQAAGRL